MSKKAFSELFRRWINRSCARTTGSVKSAKTRLRVEEVEERLAPATLPEVTVASTAAVPNTGSGFQPQVMADPLNPNTIALVASRGNGILGQISFDGGLSWSIFRNTVPVPNSGDPSGGKLLDPNLPTPGVPQINRSYTNVSSPSLAFARGTAANPFDPVNGTIYISYLEHNADKTSGALVVESFNYNRTTGAVTQNDLDPTRDWDSDGNPDSERFTRANSSNNRANVLYSWVDDGTIVNRALNPFIAIDNNIPSYTDPVTGLMTPTDGMSGNGLFVVWNTDASNPTLQNYSAPLPANYSRNAIFLSASQNGGVDFSTPVPVNDGVLPVNVNPLTVPSGGHFGVGTVNNGVAPQIIFSPGELNNDPFTPTTVTPGQMSVFWQTTANQIRHDTSSPDGGIGDPAVSTHLFRSLDFNQFTGRIQDASVPPSGNDIDGVTRFEIPVDLLSDPSFATLSDLDVTIALSHNDVRQLDIFVVAPDGTRIQLVNNSILNDGTVTTFNGGVVGILGNDMGVAQGIVNTGSNQPDGNPVGTVFSQEAARQIHDRSNPAKYIGSFRPEVDSLATLYGRTAAQLSSLPPDPNNASNPTGNWLLEIVDHRNNRTPSGTVPPDNYLRFWSLTFTSRLDNDDGGGRVGADQVVATTPFAPNTPAPPGSVTAVTSGAAADQTYANTPLQGPSPDFGIGSAVSVAYDNSLGSFSPHSGRLYLTYTSGSGADTNISLLVSDDNGLSWDTHTNFDPVTGNEVPGPVNDDSRSDNFTEGNRTQYMPTVTVDPVTGTVVLMWYDARLDASIGRASTFMATSIDGGDTFSLQTFLNNKKTAVDQVSRSTVVLEPLPSNIGAMTQIGAGTIGQSGGTGIRQSLIAYGGQIKPFWTGNLNSGGSSIFSATVRTATGPRIIGTDMGAVTQDAGDFFYGPYNNTFTADGTRRIDGFRVTFDRPIDVTTFDPSDVIVQFRSPNSQRDDSIPPTLIPVASIQALDPFFPNPMQPASATEFFVHFATPQSGVGTYSWSIGPNISDRIRSSNTSVFSASDTPLPIEDFETTESTIIVPPLVGNPTVQQLRVALNINHTFDSDLRITLVGSNGVEIVLSAFNGGSGDNYTNTRFDDNAATPIFFGTAPFNGVFQPEEPLSTFNGISVSGTWKLRVEDDAGADVGSLVSWSLSFLDGAGNLLNFTRNGNTMDQDADSLTPEPDNDVFTNPESTSGVPFTLPFDPNTLPLILPGPHVLWTGIPAQSVTVTAAVQNFFASPNAIDIALDRPVFASSVQAGDIISITDPNGATIAGPFTITPIFSSSFFDPPPAPLDFPNAPDALTGLTNKFRIELPVATISGNYQVRLGTDVVVADGLALNSTSNQLVVTFDRDIEPTSFTPANILRMAGPTGPVRERQDLTVVGTAGTFTVTVGAMTTNPLPFNAPATGPGSLQEALAALSNVGAGNVVVTATPVAGGRLYQITFVGSLANSPLPTVSAAGAGGATATVAPQRFSVAPVPGSINPNTGGTRSFIVTFPTQSIPGPYSIEFGSDSLGNTVRSIDRPQLVTRLATAGNQISVTFSATPPTGFTASDILSILGPNGAVSLAGVSVSAAANPRMFNINFPATLPTGQYVLELNASGAKALRVAGSGVGVDEDFDAGLDVLRGDDPASQTFATQVFSSTGTATIGPATPNPNDPNQLDPSFTELPINVADDFIINASGQNQIQLVLNITHPNVRDLDLDLISPAGTIVRLFTGADLVAAPPNATANFTNTLLIDRVNDPNVPTILSSRPPFTPPAGQAFSPQTPLNVLTGESSKGTWILRVTNHGTNPPTSDPNFPPGTPTRIAGWSLKLPRAVPGTGLGEAVADRFNAGFRIFTQDPTNDLTQQVWSPVGPASTNETANSARISTIAVDPSDPTGNTVYVGVAGGGVWKTTNFLTTDPKGPQYVPLTDFGPTTAVNITSIALFPRNNDPTQTIIYALTGESSTQFTYPGQFTAPGVGVLRSMDGGATWKVLDSTSNVDSGGNVLPISDPARDHAFVGSTGYKIIADPSLSRDGEVVLYMAISGGSNPGVWRSLDSGDSWQVIRAGQATDVILAAGSANTTDSVTGETVFGGNLQRLYAGFRNDGVYTTDSALSAASMDLMAGAATNHPLIVDITTVGPQRMLIDSPVSNPNGAKGRISLAVPALTGDPLKDSFLRDWLYALTQDGEVYLTKDAGQTWTRIRIPNAININVTVPIAGTNNESTLPFAPAAPPNGRPQVDVDSSNFLGQPGYNQAINIDPSNPNIVYVAGFSTNSIKLDVTKIRDPYNWTFFSNSDADLTNANIDTTGLQNITTGGVRPRTNTRGLVLIGGSDRTYSTDFLNLQRDFNNPFTTNSTIRVRGTSDATNIPGRFVNTGVDIRWMPFENLFDPGIPSLTFDSRTENRFSGTNTHAIFSVLDPVTGKTRLLFGTDDGIFTGVDDGNWVGTGDVSSGIGFSGVVNFNRNGNLQISQFYSGAVQPSQIAADLAGALFYGMGDHSGFPVSSPDMLSTGNLNWRGPTGDGVAVATDPTGSGTAYQYRSPVNFGFDLNTTALPTDFFRVLSNTSDHAFGGGFSRTGGASGSLFSQTGEFWLSTTPIQPTVNPLNRNAIVLGSETGRLYRTTNQGVTWTLVGSVGSSVDVSAFGSSDPSQPNLTNNYLFAGTRGGQIFSTLTGGAPFTNISAGLDGSSVVRIIPNPEVGKKDVFAITKTGVFYKADGTPAAAGTPWQNITGNLFSLTRSIFGDTNDQDTALKFLTSLAVDWRFAIPFPNDPSHTFPILYVGGEGGVFQSKDFGGTWVLYPSVAGDGAPVEGGYLPNTHVTDLDLSIGDLNPANGKFQPGGLNMLVATTYGRGTWAIRLDNTVPPPSFISGPRVTQLINPNTGGTSNRLQVRFSGPVDPATFTPEDVHLVGPNGSIQVTAVTLISQLAGDGSNPRDLYEISFAPVVGAAAVDLTVGYNPPSNVPLIADPSGFLMNQDGDTNNGEALVDQYRTTIFLNGATNNRLVVTASPVTATAGVPASVTIQARDANDQVITTANGPLTLTAAPGTGTFTTSPTTVNLTNGVATFMVTYTTAGPQTINASFGGLNMTSWTTNVSAATATTFTIDPASSVVNAPASVNFTVTARDQFGNQASYDGPLSITSTGAPANIPLAANMAGGIATFSGDFNTRGTVTITASGPDLNNPTKPQLSGTATVLVDPGQATQLVVTAPPGPFTTGTTVTVTVSALDAIGNLAIVNGPATVTLNPNDPNATISPATPILVNGQATFTVTFNTAGAYTVGVTSGALNGTSGTITIQNQPPVPSPTDKLTGLFGVGTGMDGSPVFQVFQANGSLLNASVPFPAGFNGEVDPASPGFTGGIRTAVADVTGDGVADYIVGTGPTITATVEVIDGASGQTIATFQPFEDFKGGVFVTAGDITGDGVNEIIITPDEGGGPRVTILRGGDFKQVANFFGIDDPNFRGGARAGVGDLNADGFADLVVSAGFGGGPRISIYDGAALNQNRFLHPVGDFFLFESALRNGAYVTVGDFDGDGFGDIVGGAGPGGAPRVLVISGNTLLTQGVSASLNSPIQNFFGGDIENRGGVRVAAKNFDGDKFSELLTGSGEGGGSQVTAYHGGDFSVLYTFDALPGYAGGVFVG